MPLRISSFPVLLMSRPPFTGFFFPAFAACFMLATLNSSSLSFF